MEFRFGGLLDALNRDLNSFCKVQHDMQEFDLIHSHAEPSLTARRLLNNSRLHGRLIGNILQVRQCRPVDSFELKKMTGPHCTEWIPLNYSIQGKIRSGYVDPKTMIISRSSSMTDCNFMDDVPMQNDKGKLFMYDRSTGQVTSVRGSVTALPMYQSELGGFGDFEMIIHRAYEMYQLTENEGVSANDYFETMQTMDEFMTRLSNLDHGEPPKNMMKSIFENLATLHPFGSFSLNWSRFHFIWQNACCTLVTLYVAWIFFMPRAIKKLIDHMIGVGKKRVIAIHERVTSNRATKPSAPTEEKPTPEPSFAEMHYTIARGE